MRFSVSLGDVSLEHPFTMTFEFLFRTKEKTKSIPECARRDFCLFF